ncbi:MAG TPA: hypothetical protein PLL78_12805 [Fimbriimonadaceae bacterium]|nr:hypothetical protein [Fimbriimonadaceae bacterium]HRJ97557.1 hypothetical protein [Fimbriimonadaceae bacterium]
MKQSDLPAPRSRSTNGAGGPACSDPLSQASSSLENGDWRSALRFAHKALRGRRDALPILEVLARARWLASDYSGVLRVTKRLIALNPAEPGYRILQAMALRGLGQFSLAVTALRRCLTETTSREAQSKALEMLDELDAIQCGAIRRLHGADPTFRRAYDRDPEAACRSLGFELTWYEPAAYVSESSQLLGHAGLDRA